MLELYYEIHKSISFSVISNNSGSVSYLEGLFWVLGCTANVEPRVALK